MVVNTASITTTVAGAGHLAGYGSVATHDFGSSNNNNNNGGSNQNCAGNANFGGLNFGSATAIGHPFKANVSNSVTCATVSSAAQESSSRQREYIQELKRSMRLDFSSPDSLKKSLTTPEILSVLNFSSPDLEKLFAQQATTLAGGGATTVNTPTPTQYFYPKHVTAEQEQYARGFLDALNQLHSLRGSNQAFPANLLLSPGFVASTIQQQDNGNNGNVNNGADESKEESTMMAFNGVLGRSARDNIRTTVSSVEQLLRSLTSSGVWTTPPSTALAPPALPNSVPSIGFNSNLSSAADNACSGVDSSAVSHSQIGGRTSDISGVLPISSENIGDCADGSLQAVVVSSSTVKENVKQEPTVVVKEKMDMDVTYLQQVPLSAVQYISRTANNSVVTTAPVNDEKALPTGNLNNMQIKQEKPGCVQDNIVILPPRQNNNLVSGGNMTARGPSSPFVPVVGENLTLTTSNTPPAPAANNTIVVRSTNCCSANNNKLVHHSAPSAAHFVTLSSSNPKNPASGNNNNNNNSGSATFLVAANHSTGRRKAASSSSGYENVKRSKVKLEASKILRMVGTTKQADPVTCASVLSDAIGVAECRLPTATAAAPSASSVEHVDATGGNSDYYDDDDTTSSTGSPSPDLSSSRPNSSSIMFRPPPGVNPIDPVVQERLKLERKRARNRLAATKCRRRKLEIISTLADRVRQIADRNELLQAEIETFRREVNDLKRQIDSHRKGGCKV